MMDDNFSNLLDGTRQYFQRLPKVTAEGGDGRPPPDVSSEGGGSGDGPRDEQSQAAMAQASWPPPPASTPKPASDPQPPPEPSERQPPPSDLLIEPEPHIIHKATVMQQAQQKQQQQQTSAGSIVNHELDRPSSVNMISPPTHIIHKPQQSGAEEKKPAAIVAMAEAFAPQQQNSSSKSVQQTSVQSKYSSHLPTPPQPSIHNSSHYHERFHSVAAQQQQQQQKNLTILQSRQTRPYTSRTYTELQPSNVNADGANNKSSISASSSSNAAYSQQRLVGQSSSGLEQRRNSSLPDSYLKSSQTTRILPTLSASTSKPMDAQIPFSRAAIGYNYPPQNHMNPSISESDKSLSNNGGMSAYAQSIQLQQKMRSLSTVRPASNHSSSAETSRHHSFNQKYAVSPHPQNSAYAQSSSLSSYSAMRSSHQDIPSHLKISSQHAYDYTGRIIHQKLANADSRAVSTSSYQERISQMEQRHTSTSTTQIPGSMNAIRSQGNEYALQYPRIPPSSIQSQKTSNEYQPQSLKSQQSNQVYSTNNSSQYATSSNHHEHSVLPNNVNSSSNSYYAQNSYNSTTVTKHSYDTSPRHTATSRTAVTKQNAGVHQQRMTVSVTSLVNQMKQVSPMAGKSKKESPLDLSVKTVRIPADSTAQDETDNTMYEKRELPSHHSGVNVARDTPSALNARHRPQPKPNNLSSSHKVDFQPNFSANTVDKVPQYREPSQSYAQNKKYGSYDPSNIRGASSNVPQAYLSKHHYEQQNYTNRYDPTSKQTYVPREYNRRPETHLPKIDLTIPESEHLHERRSAQLVHPKDDGRKRENNIHPSVIPHKMARYDGWNYDRHGRVEGVYGQEISSVPTASNFKTVNGSNYPSVHQVKHYDQNIYKKSENVDPYSKYGYPPYQHQSTRPEAYGASYPKLTTSQTYEYHASDKNITSLKHDVHVNHSGYQNQFSTTPADKRVLSILRNSLEARNLPENQKHVDNSDDCIIIQSDDNNSTHGSEVNEYRLKKVKNIDNKVARSPPPSFDSESFKVHLPKAVDSIKYDLDIISKSIRIRDDLTLPNDSGKTDLSDLSNDRSLSSDNELARIRTKAELKGFTQLNSLTKPIDGIKGSLNLIENKSLPHRRRLFSKSDNHKDGIQPENQAPSVIRSSSDSVFDFQDSGSELEVSLPSKINDNKSEPSKAESRNNIKTEKNVDEDFWTETCDNFLEQLKTGKVKRTRRKKTGPAAVEKASNAKDNLDLLKNEKNSKMNIVSIKSEISLLSSIKEEAKSSSDSSDEDQPLINKKVKKDRLLKIANESTNKISLKSESKTENSPIKRKTKIRTLAQDSKSVSSDDEQMTLSQIKQEKKKEILMARSESESDDIILSNKKGKKGGSASNMNESKSKSPLKDLTKNNEEMSLKKPDFGDGSGFRPGWEEEVYRYKQSLRMPASLINVSRPLHWPRISTSLPDLDPCSPAPSSTEEIFSQRQSDKLKQELDSDADSVSSFYMNRKANYDSEASCSTIISTSSKRLRQDNSIVDVLIQKCGKKDLKRNKMKQENNGPKIIPKAENPLELLPTPNVALDSDSQDKKLSKSSSKDKNSQYLVTFRRETVSNFRDAFINTDSRLGATQEFAPVIFNSRTRTETRVMKKRATIKEVFGDEQRPASAPPTCREEEPAMDDKLEEDLKLNDTKIAETKLKKKKKLIGMVREGLRSNRLKKNDAKGRLLRLKKRNNLFKNLAGIKLKNSLKIKKEPLPISDLIDEPKTKEEENNEIPAKKSYRRLFARKKMSSGFDYIRKKKKQIKKDDTIVKKRNALSKPNPESIHDIQKEIKGWIVNKSVGETVLHRAARHGYTDCVAYCLEKLDLSPSCRDNAGYTPLHEACSRGHLEIARLLLQYGANVSEAAQGGIRPLHEACENGYIEIIRLLLSYGADPLLATYSGQTPMSLSCGKAARLLQLHLNDVQGTIPQPWRFGPCKLLDPAESGYDPLASPPPPPSPPPSSPIEIVSSTSPLPPLYKLRAPNNNHSSASPEGGEEAAAEDAGPWCLLQDLAALLRVKSRDALLKQIHCGAGAPRDSLKELRTHEFLERAQCQQLACAGERINVRASRIALVKYTDRLQQLLNVEAVVIR